jgi:DNA-binding transcriptional LysR family regulator
VAAIISSVAAGLGVTLIPKIAVNSHSLSDKLALLPWNQDDLEVAQLMIWHQDKWLTPVLKEFMNVAREVLKKG